jgi:hypothetical protein
MERRYPPSPPARRLRDRPTATPHSIPTEPHFAVPGYAGARKSAPLPAQRRAGNHSMPNPKRGRSRSPHARRSRELRRNAATRGGTLHYRAVVAQWKAEPADVSSKGQQARRQRPAARVCAGPAVRCVDRPGSTSPMMSRCGFRTRRSARPFTFGDVGRSAAS